jgi:hypothetical protein
MCRLLKSFGTLLGVSFCHFGRTEETDGTWRIKTNDELDKLIRHKNIINYIKAQRFSWFGHLHRMPEEGILKKGIQVKTDVKKTTRETKEQMGRCHKK